MVYPLHKCQDSYRHLGSLITSQICAYRSPGYGSCSVSHNKYFLISSSLKHTCQFRLTCLRSIQPHSRFYLFIQGDSGGPLVDSTKKTVIGIVSGGNGFECGTGYPDLYTKVSNFIDYINSEMKRTSNSPSPHPTADADAALPLTQAPQTRPQIVLPASQDQVQWLIIQPTYPVQPTQQVVQYPLVPVVVAYPQVFPVAQYPNLVIPQYPVQWVYA